MSRLSIPFSEAYSAVLMWVLGSPEEHNARTGRKVRVGRGGTAFRVDLSDGRLPLVGIRRTFPRSAAAETAWYVQGTRDVSFIRGYAPLWDKFVEDDGKTVASAYGYRWREHFGRDQLGLAVASLRQNPSDRRIYVSAWDPAEDGLGTIHQRNVPCPTSFTLSVSDGELHSSLFLRSSDVFVGLPYDVMGHALLMDTVAAELGLLPGVMHVTLAHAHLYEDHFDMAWEALQQTPLVPHVPLPRWRLVDVEADPHGYVRRVEASALGLAWPLFNPKPHVVE